MSATPLSGATLQRLRNKIRHQRALLTADETWWQQQPYTDTAKQAFLEINFWRNVLRDAESRLALGDLGEAITDMTGRATLNGAPAKGGQRG